jgi:hypothetical protein
LGRTIGKPPDNLTKLAGGAAPPAKRVERGKVNRLPPPGPVIEPGPRVAVPGHAKGPWHELVEVLAEGVER